MLNNAVRISVPKSTKRIVGLYHSTWDGLFETTVSDRRYPVENIVGYYLLNCFCCLYKNVDVFLSKLKEIQQSLK